MQYINRVNSYDNNFNINKSNKIIDVYTNRQSNDNNNNINENNNYNDKYNVNTNKRQ